MVDLRPIIVTHSIPTGLLNKYQLVGMCVKRLFRKKFASHLLDFYELFLEFPGLGFSALKNRARFDTY
jgi:hypothetical protein